MYSTHTGHWTWLRGGGNELAIYPPHRSESGGSPGARIIHSWASAGDDLYLFGGLTFQEGGNYHKHT